MAQVVAHCASADQITGSILHFFFFFFFFFFGGGMENNWVFFLFVFGGLYFVQ